MRRTIVVCLAGVIAAGCGPSGGERQNDAGPPVKTVPGGPPPMKPPGEGQTTAPGQPKLKAK